MKKIVSSLLFLLAGFISMAQTEVHPPTPTEESGGSSVGVKIAIAVVAVAIMALIFYIGKKLNKKKQSS